MTFSSAILPVCSHPPGLIGLATNFAVAFAKTCRSLGKRTNDISRAYLEAAADGQVSERLADVAKSVAAGEAEPRVAETVASAMAVGHSSGADGTLGLLQGLASWGPASVFSRGSGLVDELARAAAAHKWRAPAAMSL